MNEPDRGRPRSSIFRAAIGVTIAGVISSTHHIYGAFVYETPWRMIVSIWIPAFVMLILAVLFLLRRSADRTVTTIAAWIVLLGGVVFQIGFTAFECVYSHILKNILFFGGASKQLLERLFPAPAYHLPDSLPFELTGIAQIVGFWAAWLAWRVFVEYSRD